MIPEQWNFFGEKHGENCDDDEWVRNGNEVTDMEAKLESRTDFNTLKFFIEEFTS